ncbi:MAG: hypothetical protein AAFZ07_14175 [Actinomycetota bacterium]
MRRVLLLVALVASACSGGADAATDELCEEGDLACAILDEADLRDVFGDEVEVERAVTVQLGTSVDWCDALVPSPVERVDLGYTATSGTNGVTVAVTSSVLRYEGADAEVTTEVLTSLRQGCSWTEGDVEFRVLDEIDVAGFGDEAVGLLIRAAAGEVEDNAEIIVIRRGDVLSQVGLFPAQDSPVLWDALGRRMDDRLRGVSPQ